MSGFPKILTLWLFTLIAVCANAQENGEQDNKKYVNVDKTNPDAVVLEEPDRFSDPIAGLSYQDEIEVLDEEKGGYVKVRVKVKGKLKEGWVKKSILDDERAKPSKAEASEAEGSSSSVLAAKGSVGMDPIDMEGFDQDTQQDPWDYIDPIAPQAKIVSNPLPYHLIIPGALIVGGGALAAILALTSNDPDPAEPEPPQENEPPVFNLLNDAYTIFCGQSLNIFPLQNDQGTGLTILEINDAPEGIQLLNDSTIIISPTLNGEVTFTIDIEDAVGQVGTTTVTIDVEEIEIQAVGESFEISAGEVITGNVLQNDLCFGCLVVDTSGEGGNLVIQENGDFEFSVTDDFSGEAVYTVLIENPCGTVSSSELVFIVNPQPPCSFEWGGNVQVVPADCGLSNGAAFATEELFGPYNFSWSNGVDIPENEDISPGMYQLFVTDTTFGCVDTLVAEISELPPDYMLDAVVDPGTCGGVDDVVLNSNASAENTLQIVLSGSTSGALEVENNSPIALGDFITLNPGDLTISVFSELAGPGCTEEVQLILEQSQLPGLTLVDDVFEVEAGEILTGSFLINDICEGCTVQSVSGGEGQLDWQVNGDFSYVAPEETGEIQFTATVIDFCGQIDTQTLTFIIEVPPPCGFDWAGSIETVAADCGQSNGSANAVGDITDIEFTWNNGIAGAVNENIPTGEVQLFVTQTETGCTDTLVATIDELPADYSTEATIIPGGCGEPDNVQLTTNAALDNELTVSLSGAAVGVIENVTETLIALGDFVVLTPGNLTITVWSNQQGTDCSQTIDVIIGAGPPIPELVVADIVQPQPPENIGTIILDIIGAALPADVVVNGEVYTTALAPQVILDGLPPGPYLITLVDFEGCESLPVEVILEEPGINPLTESMHWSPQTMGMTNWINSQAELLLQTKEGQGFYSPVTNPSSVPVYLELSNGRWVMSGAYSRMAGSASENGTLSGANLRYFEFSGGNTFEIVNTKVVVKLGFAECQRQGADKANLRAGFIDGVMICPLKSISGQLQLGVRVGIIASTDKLVVLPKVQYAFGQ